MPPSCTLDGSWSAVSVGGGAVLSQFAGGGWAVPETLLVDGQGYARNSGTPAIRVITQGDCNTSHTIRVSSQNGGLRRTGGAASGFLAVRSMQYTAQWHQSQNGSAGGANMGPNVTLTTSGTPGQSVVGTYTVSGSLPAPGDNRRFDLRMQLNPAPGSQVMMAGEYADVVTITLSVL
ncbi:hypothetical protein [Brevundimonas lenta]|uniref:Spore coat protein U domain-containing protein n=1 Tax=Brevundimonas lenta TaxID=424796 RepID=A0A7W6JBY9_9CAUL|nr:hypothetical protein [Brevundimonas lenta]MBB4082328.1 hypothetical protein [Brevundimonas lenta]